MTQHIECPRCGLGFAVMIGPNPSVAELQSKLDQVADWARRHAEHGGEAHLSELRAILAVESVEQPGPTRGWLSGLGGR